MNLPADEHPDVNDIVDVPNPIIEFEKYHFQNNINSNMFDPGSLMATPHI